MRILITTDTWNKNSPNGVITLISSLIKVLKDKGHEIMIIHPNLFLCIPNLNFPGIDQPINLFSIPFIIKKYKPDAIHIFTEGNIAASTLTYLNIESNINIPYTSCYLVRIPELNKKLFDIPLEKSWKIIRYFHENSKTILVPCKSLYISLNNELNYKTLKEWSHGIDLNKYNPKYKEYNHHDLDNFKKPIILCVSRCSPEKGIENFCKIDTSGTLVFVGYGKKEYYDFLKNKYNYKNINFLGKKMDNELSIIYSKADVFVFPSCNDTFGLTMIESIASGTPVAAFKTIGPIDIIEEGVNGYMVNPNESLNLAIIKCLKLDRNIIYKSSKKWSIENIADDFIDSLNIIPKETWNYKQNYYLSIKGIFIRLILTFNTILTYIILYIKGLKSKNEYLKKK